MAVFFADSALRIKRLFNPVGLKIIIEMQFNLTKFGVFSGCVYTYVIKKNLFLCVSLGGLVGLLKKGRKPKVESF